MFRNRGSPPIERRMRMQRLWNSAAPRAIRRRRRYLFVTILVAFSLWMYLVHVRIPSADESAEMLSKEALTQKPVLQYPGSLSHGAPWTTTEDFEDALSKLKLNLPSKRQSRKLLGAIGGIGTDKLRDLGSRVRVFKGLFDIWEKVHFFKDAEGSMSLREGVLQHLYKMTVEDDANREDKYMSKHWLKSSIQAYESYRLFMSKFTELLFPWYHPFYPSLLDLKMSFARGGRGIVLTASDSQVVYLLTTIPSFRKLGCDLPIEVIYLGDSDLSSSYRADLEAIPGVSTRDITQMVNDKGWELAGWAIKPFAILLSSFREVLFIDADSAFFRNPAELFDHPSYKTTGALFFRDRLILPESKRRWLQKILPKPISYNVQQSRLWTGSSGHQQESGVVVVDKWRHFVALLFVTLMNGPDRDKGEGSVGVYEMMHGDKETFWIGWELVGDLDYSWHQGDCGAMGLINESGEGTIDPKNYTLCSPQILHLDLDGKPLWFNGWLLRNKFANNKLKRFARFKDYIIEPRDTRTPAAWQLAQDNMACLTTDPFLKHSLCDENIEYIEWMIDLAIKTGAPGQRD